MRYSAFSARFNARVLLALFAGVVLVLAADHAPRAKEAPIDTTGLEAPAPPSAPGELSRLTGML